MVTLCTTAIAVLALLAIPTPHLEASPDGVLHKHTFRLGLKDARFRNRQGVEALQTRIRARLRAAQLNDYTTSIDGPHNELKVTVTTSLGNARLRTLLLSTSTLSLVPVAPGGDTLAGLSPLLPDGVVLSEEERHVEGGASSAFLHSSDVRALTSFAQTIILPEHRVHVAPALLNSKVPGSRTYMVRNDAPNLGSGGLAGVSIHPHTYPNYYYIRAYWNDEGGDATTQSKATPQQQLSGASGLLAVTQVAARTTGRMLLLIDGQPASVLSVPEPIDSGVLVIRLPVADQDSQRSAARFLAGRMASGPHPCDIVVIRAAVERL
ncbi:MAG: hypothetical protein AAFX99_16705 [Myxococcota bacterium]